MRLECSRRIYSVVSWGKAFLETYESYTFDEITIYLFVFTHFSRMSSTLESNSLLVLFPPSSFGLVCCAEDVFMRQDSVISTYVTANAFSTLDEVPTKVFSLRSLQQFHYVRK